MCVKKCESRAFDDEKPKFCLLSLTPPQIQKSTKPKTKGESTQPERRVVSPKGCAFQLFSDPGGPGARLV